MKQVLQKAIFLLLQVCLGAVWLHAADPTVSASDVQFPTANIDGAQFQLTFKPGNGTGGRIVVVKAGSEITGVPVDGTRYGYDAAFGTPGTEFTKPGEFLVGHLTGATNNLTVKNLVPGTSYYVAIFELNGSYATPSTIDYSMVTPTGRSVTTLVAPATPATLKEFTQVTGNSVRVNWTNGSGQGRIVVARKGSTLTDVPTNLAFYNYLTAFGTGTSSTYMLSPGTYVVYKNTTASTVSAEITNLEPNTTYTFAIFEYNGNATPVYTSATETKTVTTHAGPTQPSTNISFSKINGNRIDVTPNKGNGTQTLLVVSKNGPITQSPLNGTTYTANPIFGTAEAEWYPGSGEYVVSSSSSGIVTVTGWKKPPPIILQYSFLMPTPMAINTTTRLPFKKASAPHRRQRVKPH